MVVRTVTFFDSEKLCTKQENCREATKELTGELEDFIETMGRAIDLKDRTEMAADTDRMLELISMISDHISQYSSSRIYGMDIILGASRMFLIV